jgi:hypothetical protein
LPKHRRVNRVGIANQDAQPQVAQQQPGHANQGLIGEHQVHAEGPTSGRNS